MSEINYIQLEKMDDLVKMIVTSMRPPPLHHVTIGKKNFYFIPTSMGIGRTVIYIVEQDEKIEKRYVVYDTMQDTFSYSDEISTKPSLKHFVIVEVKTENLLPKNLLG